MKDVITTASTSTKAKTRTTNNGNYDVTDINWVQTHVTTSASASASTILSSSTSMVEISNPDLLTIAGNDSHDCHEDDDDNDNDKAPSISKKQFPIAGFRVIHDFISDEEMIQLIRQIDEDSSSSSSKKKFAWEGFEQPRKRVLRYSPPSSKVPSKTIQHVPSLVRVLMKRLSGLGFHPSSVAIEEYPPNQLSRFLYVSKTTVTTFESRGYDDSKATTTTTTDATEGNGDGCGDVEGRSSRSDYFVGQIVLTNHTPLIEYVDRPMKRHNYCWDLLSPNHWTGLKLVPRSLYIKSEEILWDWRSRIAARDTSVEARLKSDHAGSVGGDANTGTNNKGDRLLLLKLYSLPTYNEGESETTNFVGSGFGQNDGSNGINVEADNDHLSYSIPPIVEKQQLPIPPLHELLTIIVTTSPIQSNPSTELLERVFDTFTHCGTEFAYTCPKLVICDGCRTLEEDNGKDDKDTNDRDNDSTASTRRNVVSKKHTTFKQAMRNGIVTSKQATNYSEFKHRLRHHVQMNSTNKTSPFQNTRVVELQERVGYGYALRHALQHIQTPYVIVIQHDRTFMRPTPLKEVLGAMWQNPHQIKYVGLSMRSNLLYRDIFVAKYGRKYHDEMNSLIARPQQLELSSQLYGPDSESTRNMDYNGNVKLKGNIQALVETYKRSQQSLDYLHWKKHKEEQGQLDEKVKIDSDATPLHQLSLIPTFFWYDNIHVCQTKHYRDFIFNPKYKMVAKGGFVEDKVSIILKKTVERFGLTQGHSKFACFLLDDHSGMFFTGHLDGGSYLTLEQKKGKIPLRGGGG